MVEYLLTSMSPPDSELYPWMSVRATEVKTAHLSLISETPELPTLAGFPSSRLLVVRFRDNRAPGNNMQCNIPEVETGLYHDMLNEANPGDITFTDLVSNGTRLGHETDIVQNLAFDFHQTSRVTGGMMHITLDFLVYGLEQNASSLPNGTSVGFTVQMFYARMANFADEIPIPGDLGNDRMFIEVSGSGATSTNKHTLHFVTGTPPNTFTNVDDYFIRFKIARDLSTTDASTIWINEVTLTATSFDYVP